MLFGNMSTPSPAGTSIFILLITSDDEFVVEVDDGEEVGDSTVDVRFLFCLIGIGGTSGYNQNKSINK